MTVFIHILVWICTSLSYATAYAVGGRDTAPLVRPRIWRRFIAPLALTIPLIAYSLFLSVSAVKYVSILSVGTYIGAMFIQKYGGDTLWQKVRGRIYSGLVVGSASLPIAISTGSWKLFTAQVILAISAHLVLGIKNPFEASKEEFLISLSTVALVPWMIFHV